MVELQTHNLNDINFDVFDRGIRIMVFFIKLKTLFRILQTTSSLLDHLIVIVVCNWHVRILAVLNLI